MMEQRIYFSFLISVFLLFIGIPVLGQSSDNNNRNRSNNNAIQYPLYNGVTVSTDIWGLGSKMFGSDFLSVEVAADVSLKNRFFPALEIGYGTTNTSESDKGITYKTSAPFFRIGMNYNTMYKKREDYFLYVGARYGFSSFNYDVLTFIPDNGIGVPTLIDNDYGGMVEYNHPGLKGSMHWVELLLGVRVTVYKNFKMGWTIRMKNRLTASKSEHGDPWYIPGFGKYGSSNLGITYSLIYKLPF